MCNAGCDSRYSNRCVPGSAAKTRICQSHACQTVVKLQIYMGARGCNNLHDGCSFKPAAHSTWTECLVHAYQLDAMFQRDCHCKDPVMLSNLRLGIHKRIRRLVDATASGAAQSKDDACASCRVITNHLSGQDCRLALNLFRPRRPPLLVPHVLPELTACAVRMLCMRAI